ncbi:MAG: hypothetical protein JRG97_00555 [Deltaproteobacteria bacterium]|nr:hypothetical protein [Deltaproteobacteria bacterium]MBW2050888.1 hypothetical protein [Deltaproteobacteria bacterium]MBW2139547.1 hypothetical protein [Deltaproteobacteria bacterium]MBW2322617.1 hypothetical protein [Deltaproteobacteria bacterium]
MKNLPILIKIIISALPLLLVISIPSALALTEEQKKSLIKTGFSRQTVSQLSALEQDPNRTIKPRLTFETVKQLAAQGLPENIIQLLLRLDQVSAAKPQMTVSPEAVMELKKAGASNDTIRLMLESEIQNAKGRPRKDMGKWVVTRPDGSKVIIYSVGDPKKPLPSLSQRQEEELKKALEVLKHLNITIEYPFRK